MLIHVNDANFEKLVASTKGVLVVDFWAEWCGPCQMLGPVLQEFAEKHPEVTVAKCNVDENPLASRQMGVQYIPFLCYFKDGELRKSHSGLVSVADIEANVAAL